MGGLSNLLSIHPYRRLSVNDIFCESCIELEPKTIMKNLSFAEEKSSGKEQRMLDSSGLEKDMSDLLQPTHRNTKVYRLTGFAF